MNRPFVPRPLILGGTSEASALAHQLAKQSVDGIFSYAGRVKTPKAQPLTTRIGGFGGVDGLAKFIVQENITHVIDATHPFAKQMSENAFYASEKTNTPLLTLTRPAWQPTAGDNWISVATIGDAVEYLSAAKSGMTASENAAKRVFLATGRQHIAEFSKQSHHHYVVRVVDEPSEPLPFQHCDVVVDRGPFSYEGERDLLSRHQIDLIVCKNAGGAASEAKLIVAKELGIPVLMVQRPTILGQHEPVGTHSRVETHSVEEALQWLNHCADLGV